MSSYPNQPGQPQQIYYQPPPTNGLGIAGFVVSLSGLIICLGLICPIGLILSLIALTKAPRSFAIAGSIVGALGTILGTLTILAVSGVIGNGLFNANYFGLSATSYEIDNASYAIDTAFSTNQDTLPDEPTGDTLISSYTDEWNNNLKYLPTTGTTQDYTITSPGPDGQLGTADDITQYYTAQTQTDLAMENAEWDIDDYHTTHGRLPTTPHGTGLIITYHDSWGNALRYELSPSSNQDFNLISAGPDGQFGNTDDVTQTYSGYIPFSQGQFGAPDPEELAENDIAVTFDLAAKKIIGAFPVGTEEMPTAALVHEKAGELVDPWLTPMRYSPTDNPPIYHLKSAGPDKTWDTPDDLTRSFYFVPTGQTDGPP